MSDSILLLYFMSHVIHCCRFTSRWFLHCAMTEDGSESEAKVSSNAKMASSSSVWGSLRASDVLEDEWNWGKGETERFLGAEEER